MSRFKAHYNSAMGKYYYEKKDYLSDMKKMGLQPYSGPKKSNEKQYKTSEWAHKMVEEIKNRNGAKPGSRFYKALEKKHPDFSIENMKKNRLKAEKMVNG